MGIGVGGGAVVAVGAVVGVADGGTVVGVDAAVGVSVALGRDAVAVGADDAGVVLPVELHAELSITQTMRHKTGHFLMCVSPRYLERSRRITIRRSGS